jgi:hypothetical protein
MDKTEPVLWRDYATVEAELLTAKTNYLREMADPSYSSSLTALGNREQRTGSFRNCTGAEKVYDWVATPELFAVLLEVGDYLRGYVLLSHEQCFSEKKEKECLKKLGQLRHISTTVAYTSVHTKRTLDEVNGMEPGKDDTSWHQQDKVCG